MIADETGIITGGRVQLIDWHGSSSKSSSILLADSTSVDPPVVWKALQSYSSDQYSNELYDATAPLSSAEQTATRPARMGSSVARTEGSHEPTAK